MFDLAHLASIAETSGVQWSYESEDLDCTLLSWREGEGVPEHRTEEVDVLVIVLGGEGRLSVDGAVSALGTGQAALIPKGSTRSLTAASERFTHLNVHKRRKRLGLSPIGAYPRG